MQGRSENKSTLHDKKFANASHFHWKCRILKGKNEWVSKSSTLIKVFRYANKKKKNDWFIMQVCRQSICERPSGRTIIYASVAN